MIIKEVKLNIIEIRNLSKSFSDVQAVKNISFNIKKGEIFGFLGPNGAGKTTTINMLTGLARPTSGEIMIAGEDGIRDIKKVQEIIGIVADESNLYADMSGFENLVFCASLYGMRKAECERRARELLKQFDLDDIGERPFKAFSKGMKRKLTIAAGIIHEPEILFLDEPTSGIDVESARQIRTMVEDLNGKGTTVFLTTHYIEDAERLCDRVGFIVKGEIIEIKEVDKLIAEAQRENIIEFKIDSNIAGLEDSLIDLFPKIRVKETSENSIKISSYEEIELMPFMKFFDSKGVEVKEAKIIKPSLEDVFVEITGLEMNKSERKI